MLAQSRTHGPKMSPEQKTCKEGDVNEQKGAI